MAKVEAGQAGRHGEVGREGSDQAGVREAPERGTRAGAEARRQSEADLRGERRMCGERGGVCGG